MKAKTKKLQIRTILEQLLRVLLYEFSKGPQRVVGPPLFSFLACDWLKRESRRGLEAGRRKQPDPRATENFGCRC